MNSGQSLKLLASLRRAGYRVTTPRRTVIEALIAAKGHVTARELIDAVEDRDPSIGRVSVYRALDVLTGLGLVQATSLGGATATYILVPEGHHYHIICQSCGQVVEFSEELPTTLFNRIASGLGWQLLGHLVELYGRCTSCITRQGERREARANADASED